MIQFELDKPVLIKPLDEVPINKYASHGTANFNDEVTESLDDAIAKQREFLNR